jgi:hypothetical protein
LLAGDIGRAITSASISPDSDGSLGPGRIRLSQVPDYSAAGCPHRPALGSPDLCRCSILPRRALLDSIDASTVVGLRDRALIGLMVYSFAPDRRDARHGGSTMMWYRNAVRASPLVGTAMPEPVIHQPFSQSGAMALLIDG